MANIPSSIQEVSNRMRSDVQSTLPESNPFLQASVLDAIIKASAARHYDTYQQLNLTYKNLFPDTATGESLEAWGAYRGITRNPATQSTGFITTTGNIGTNVPAGTLYSNQSGQQYETLASSTVSEQVISISELNSIGLVATATTSSEHNLASGVLVTISGANETEYNGNFVVTVISETQFQYMLLNTTSPNASGTLLCSANIAIMSIESLDYGASTNLLSGSQLVVGTPIAGLNNNAYVQFTEIGGGTDIESDEDLRTRIEFAWQNPVTPFNQAQITLTCRSVPGVTRVFVYPITPNVGDVTVYFTRDNDANIIPSGLEVDTVKQKIIDEILPANMDPNTSLFVLAPIAIPVDFSFLSISPNTSAMRNAIIENLTVFFREKTTVGKTITRREYECAILQSVDTESGLSLQDFTLATPTNDIVLSVGELGVLGNVSFL